MNMKLNTSSIRIETSAGYWYDLWHAHPDIKGIGNQSKETRHTSLQRLRQEYLSILDQLKGWEVPHQSWALIDPTDSGQDAIYVHTPNPNKENIPYLFEGVSWARSRVPMWVTSVFHSNEFKLGRSVYNGHVMYWAKSPNPSLKRDAAKARRPLA
jgi:hypothetical protein